MNTSTSATPDKYYWMRYMAARGMVLSDGKTKVKISQRDLFGVREVRGKEVDEIIFVDGAIIKLPIKKSEALMNRSNEFNGKVPAIRAKMQKAFTKVTVKPGVKKAETVQPESTQHDARFKALLRKVNVAEADLTKIKAFEFKDLMSKCMDDAERAALKQWILRHLPRTSVLYKKIEKFNVVAAKTTKIIISAKRKSIETKLTPTTNNGTVRIRLSELELPDEDDFTDYSIPAEFQKYAKVESSSFDGNWAQFIATAGELKGISPDTLSEFNQIITTHIKPTIEDAKKLVEGSIKIAAAKLKAWAMIHLAQARKIGTRTDLFERLINHSEAATKQLAYAMLGIKVAPTNAHGTATEKNLDDILDGIKL